MAQKKNPPQKKGGPLQKRARRDVMFAIDPILDEIKRQQEITEREYEQNASRVENIYSGLGDELAPLGTQYQKAAQGISGDLNASLGELAGLLAPNVESANAYINPGAEAAAGAGMFGAIGAGGQTMLASDRSRQLGWDTSLQREVPLQSAQYEKRFLQDFRETIDDLKNQRFDVMQDVPSQVLARLDQLRDSKRQNRLAKAELELREQIADREGDRADKAFRHQKKTENNSVQFAQDELSRREAEKRIKNIRGDVGELKDRLGTINDKIDYYGQYGGPEAQGYAQQLERLRRKKRRVKGNIKRKRKTIQGLR